MAFFESSKLTDSQGQAIDPADNSVLTRILSALSSPIGFDRSLNRQRSTTVLESGTVTTCSTVTTVTTVTTCSTVTNLASIGGYTGNMLVNGANYSAWASTNRNLIS